MRHWQNIVVVVLIPRSYGYSQTCAMTYVGVFAVFAHHLLRETPVATINPDRHNEYMCVANCQHCTFL